MKPILAGLGAKVGTHSLRSYTRAEDEIVSDPIAVPAGALFVQVEITRDSLPATSDEVFRSRIELSMDGGLSWSPVPSGQAVWPWGVFPVAFGALGGEARNRLNEVEGISAVYNIPLPAGEDRFVRTALVPLADIQVSMSVLFTATKQV